MAELTTPIRLRGRHREQRLIESLLDEARAGRSGALLITGDPGTGRSALLHAASRMATGFTLHSCNGVPDESQLPFAGLHRMLNPFANHIPALPSRQANVLSQALGLGDATELDASDRYLLAIAVSTVLSQVAADNPLLVLIDDTEWIDTPSRDILAFIARRPTSHPLAMLFTAPDEDEPLLPGLTVLPLSPLDEEAVAALVGDLTGDRVAEGVRLRLAGAAEGNPVAATELVAALSDDQLLGAQPLPEPLPTCVGLERAYLRRVRHLPEPTQRLLLIIAATERMDPDLVALAAQAAGMQVEALEPAEAAGLVRVVHGEVSFRHSLLRAAIYRGATLARRRAAHTVLAQVFHDSGHPELRAWHRAAALLGPASELADDLENTATNARSYGGHSTASAAYERAAELTIGDDAAKARRLAAAARDAWHAGSSTRARSLLDRAMPVVPSGAARGELELLRGDIDLRDGRAIDAYEVLLTAARRLAPVDTDLTIRAMVRAGEASVYAGDHARFINVAAQAAALRRHSYHDRRHSTDSASRPSRRWPAQADVMLDYLAGISAVFKGDFAAAIKPLRTVLDRAPEIDDPSALIWASIAALILGDHAQGRVMAGRAVSMAYGRGAVMTVPKALEFNAYAEFWTGRHAAATANALEGLRVATATGQGNGACHHIAALALLDAIQGDEETCRLRAKAALDRAALNGLGLPAALSTWALAFLDLSLGRHAAAAARLRDLARAGPGHGHVAVAALSVPHYVEAAVRSGATDAARAAFAKYERWATSTSSSDNLALTERCRALLSDGPSAEEHYRAALQLHATGERAFERARTELLYGSLLRRQRRRTQARAELRSALETFERFGARRWAEATRAELRATGESARPRTTESADAAGELTPQQQQIADFVARGATNREIAEQMFLSPRTVEHHLGNIFTKLGVRSRVELVQLLSRS